MDKIGDLDSIVVDSDYSGPRFGDDGQPITLEFVKEMMEHLRLQRKLHRKYALRIMVAAKDLFTPLPSLVDVSINSPDARLTICGDIHGQVSSVQHPFITSTMICSIFSSLMACPAQTTCTSLTETLSTEEVLVSSASSHCLPLKFSTLVACI